MKVELYTAGEKGNNGRYYPREELDAVVASFAHRDLVVTFEDYSLSITDISLERMVGVAELSWNGNVLEAEIFVNPWMEMGKVFTELYNAGVPMQCLPLASGKVDPNGKVSELKMLGLVIPTRPVRIETELQKIQRWTSGKPRSMFTIR